MLVTIVLAAIAIAQSIENDTFGGTPRTLEGQQVTSSRYPMVSPQPVGSLMTDLSDGILSVVAATAEGERPSESTAEGHVVVRISAVNEPRWPCVIEQTTLLAAGESTTSTVVLGDACDLKPTLYTVLAKGWAYIDGQPYRVLGSQPIYFRYDGTSIHTASNEEWAAESRPNTTDVDVSTPDGSRDVDLREEILAKGLSDACEAALLEALTVPDLDLRDPDDVANVATALTSCEDERP